MSFQELEGGGEELAFAEAELACLALKRIALQTDVFPGSSILVIWHRPKLGVVSIGLRAAGICRSLHDVLSVWRRVQCRQESFSGSTAPVVVSVLQSNSP